LGAVTLHQSYRIILKVFLQFFIDLYTVEQKIEFIAEYSQDVGVFNFQLRKLVRIVISAQLS